MAASSPRFPDISEHWARPFIEGLADKGIISGFPGGTFQPSQAMSRAQFAALLQQAIEKQKKRPYVPFVDVPAKHWAASAIQKAYETGFLSGYPGNRFRPDASISRMEVWISLVSGLEIKLSQGLSDLQAKLPTLYLDADQIPAYAREKIALATKVGIVVNPPEEKYLKPLNSASRADVAAFVYESLVYLGKMPQLPPEEVITELEIVEVGHRREFRGAWVATSWNSDWPSQKGLSVSQQKQELMGILDRVQDLKMNAVFLQVRPTGDALYISQLEPWSEWLTGVQGKAPDPLYDPLELAIAEAHKRNIELHAWFNPYRASTSTKSAKVKPHIAVTHPEYVYPYGGGLWMDPGAKVVQDWTYNVITDVVRRYKIDGIHLDDYFYPYPQAGESFPDHKTYQAYQQQGGKLALADWRRENVHQMVERLSTGIRALKPQVSFGISPFGIYRPGQPSQARGFDQYEGIFADPKKWLEEGWVDYIAPQLYWRIEPIAQSYPLLLEWWTEHNPQGRHIYAGNALYKMERENWPLSEYEKQVEISRNLASEKSLGNIFFNMKVLSENPRGIADSFKNSIYTQPALPPLREWLDTVEPPLPSGVAGSGGKLTWHATANQDIRFWTLYHKQGESWTLEKILPVATTEIRVASGTYAICTVDWLANESKGVVVSV